MLVECWTRDQKVVSLSPGRSSKRIFFSRINLLCWLLLGVHFTPCYHHFSKSAGGRLYLLIHTPLTKQSRSGFTMLSRFSMEYIRGNKLTHNSSGTIQPQLSQLTEPLWTHSDIQSGTYVCELIFTWKIKSAGRGMKCQTFPQKFSEVRKKAPLEYSGTIHDHLV